MAPALPHRGALTVKNFSLFKKSRSVVGLDIGSSAVKAVELKAAGKGFRVAAYGSEPIPPDSIVDGAIIDSARRRRVDPPRLRIEGVQDQGSRGVALGQRRDRQEDLAAGHDRHRARRIDLLGSRAVHPVRHPGRQPRLSDSRCRRRARFEGHDGSAAGRGEERKDCRLHGRHRAGGTDAGRGRRRRLRAAERLRAELRLRAQLGRRAAERRRQRHQHQHHRERTVGLHARHLAWRQRLHRGRAARAEPAVRKRGAPQEGSAGRRRDVRGRAFRCCAR